MKRSKIIVLFALISVAAVFLSGCMTLNIELPTVGSVTPSVNNEITSSEITNPPQADTSAPIQEQTAAPDTQALQQEGEETQAPATQAISNDPLSFSKEQLLSWFNESVNKVKTQKAGFSKSKITTIPELSLTNNLANSVSDLVVGMLVKGEPEVTQVANGASSDNAMSPSGKAFVSNLTSADITDISVAKSGANYVVTVNVRDEVNPNKANSAYGRVFDFLSKEDLIDVYVAKLNASGKLNATLPPENCTMTMSGGTAVAEITPDGKLVKYETTILGGIDVSECSVKVLVTLSTGFNCVLKSVTTYTDFVW